MTSTTRKNRNLMAEPMAEKGVRVLPGIGDVLGGRLEESGCDRAYMVQGQYLVMGKDEESFKDWLKDTCGANAKQQRDCYNCVRDWSDSFQ